MLVIYSVRFAFAIQSRMNSETVCRELGVLSYNESLEMWTIKRDDMNLISDFDRSSYGIVNKARYMPRKLAL